jgi:septal ring factor EnvC (AmiA/AmiB activator)
MTQSAWNQLLQANPHLQQKYGGSSSTQPKKRSGKSKRLQRAENAIERIRRRQEKEEKKEFKRKEKQAEKDRKKYLKDQEQLRKAHTKRFPSPEHLSPNLGFMDSYGERSMRSGRDVYHHGASLQTMGNSWLGMSFGGHGRSKDMNGAGFLSYRDDWLNL